MKIDYVPAKLARLAPLDTKRIRTSLWPWVPSHIIVRAVPDEHIVFVKLLAENNETGDRISRSANVVKDGPVEEIVTRTLIVLVEPEDSEASEESETVAAQKTTKARRTKAPVPPPPTSVPDDEEEAEDEG